MVGIITFEWFIDEDTIDEEQTKKLRKEAINTAKEMIENGITDGELNGSVTKDNDEVDIRGWWGYLNTN